MFECAVHGGPLCDRRHWRAAYSFSCWPLRLFPPRATRRRFRPTRCGRSSGWGRRRSLPDGSGAVVPVTSYDVKGDKALTDLWLVPTTPGEARQLTSHEGSESSPTVEPRREVDRLRGQARRRRERADLPAAVGRGRGPAPHERADRRLGSEVVSRQPSGSPSSAACGPTSRPGTSMAQTPEGAQGLEDDRARLRQGGRSATGTTGSTTARPTSTRSAIDGGEPKAVTLGTRPGAVEAGSRRRAATTSRPTGTEIAFAANSDPTGIEPELRRVRDPRARAAPRAT